MSQIIAIYYQHTNGSLICKPGSDAAADIRDSDFAVAMWFITGGDRACGWSMLVEALAGGANIERIRELANRWFCDDTDAGIYARHIGLTLELDGGQFCAKRGDFVNLQDSPAGFGPTALEAMADLCKTLGYKPSKMWPQTFPMLVAV